MESEAAHGTVTRHYRRHQRGAETSTNSIASIYAWTRGLAFVAKKENNQALLDYTSILEKACIEVVEGGKMTVDLAKSVYSKEIKREHFVTTEEYIDLVAEKLEKGLNK